jgi:hypothetical protein
MSAMGHKRTFAAQKGMSALSPIATANADMKILSRKFCRHGLRPLPHSIWGYARGRNGVTAVAAERPCCHGAVKAFFDASVARLNPCFGGPVLRIGCRCPSLTRSEVGIDRNSMRPDVGSAQIKVR